MQLNFRMTLLLAPPASGKTTLLLALAGKLDSKLKVNASSDQQIVLLQFKMQANDLKFPSWIGLRESNVQWP